MNDAADGWLDAEEEQLLRRVGYGDSNERSGTAVLVDNEMRVASSAVEGVEIMPLHQALGRYDWVQDLMFKLIAPDENELLRQSSELLNDPIGQFLYVHEGTRVTLPLQSFTLMEMPQGRQFTHNITVIDKNAVVEMISGAAVPANVHAGHHVSIDETYVLEGARWRSISIEQWGENMQVDSYSRSDIANGAEVDSTQIMLAPLRRHVSDTKTWVGAGARCNDQAIVFAPEGTERQFRGETWLTEPGAQAENVARMVSAGGRIVNRALLVGSAPGTSGFLGCDGLKLSEAGEILAEPSLKAESAKSELSHEASVGMIGEDKLAYLMASGLAEDRARDLIVQGFLSLKPHFIPEEMRAEVAEMITAARTGGM